ncbi:hypothetical protein AB1Y20_001312 [Prymnesium parvum]|uniref:EF-hand domain-containing protein n=1 Tax=Prymnesium parvum TaxID=97485 RepID=A0AB34KAH6_PRYPA
MRESRGLTGSYEESDFTSACSSIAFDIDANGVVQEADIEMFTYFLLNRQILDESVFCPELRQWLDPTLDGLTNVKDWLYLRHASAGKKLLMTSWKTQCTDNFMHLVVEAKNFNDGDPKSEVDLFFDIHFASNTSLSMVIGNDTTAESCHECIRTRDYVISSAVTHFSSSGTWTKTFEAAAQVQTTNSFEIALYLKLMKTMGANGLQLLLIGNCFCRVCS